MEGICKCGNELYFIMRGISWLAEKPRAQEGLCSMAYIIQICIVTFAIYRDTGFSFV
jgi:cytochrome bd-type quinol oxidase subunit 2